MREKLSTISTVRCISSRVSHTLKFSVDTTDSRQLQDSRLLKQGSRVRPIWSHVHPNFSRVRLTKIPGRTGASSHSRKEKKSIRDSETLVQQKTPPLGLYRGLNQSEIVKGGPPPLIGRDPDIPVCVCVRVWRCVCCCSQRERWVSRDARSSFSESDLFSERLTVSPGFCDRWIYRKIMQTPLFSKLLQILLLDASCDVIAMRIQSKKGCFSVQKMEWTALRSLHARFTRATLDKRTESGTNPRYSFGLQTVYLLGPAPRAALDHATPLYTALELAAESITFLSDLVRSIQIRHIIMLKLQISEQTPLMWKTGETLFNKHKSPPFTINLI